MKPDSKQAATLMFITFPKHVAHRREKLGSLKLKWPSKVVNNGNGEWKVSSVQSFAWVSFKSHDFIHFYCHRFNRNTFSAVARFSRFKVITLPMAYPCHTPLHMAGRFPRVIAGQVILLMNTLGLHWGRGGESSNISSVGSPHFSLHADKLTPQRGWQASTPSGVIYTSLYREHCMLHPSRCLPSLDHRIDHIEFCRDANQERC